VLFKFCPTCKTSDPLIETREVGTMAEVHTSCRNFDCPRKECVWRSQPNMTGTKIPAGNFLLCFAILLAGGSASKVFQIFSHMGLACISLRTFFEHQRVRLLICHVFYTCNKLKLNTATYVFYTTLIISNCFTHNITVTHLSHSF
jgi:hypothetical protein